MIANHKYEVQFLRNLLYLKYLKNENIINTYINKIFTNPHGLELNENYNLSIKHRV